jgi:general secretion pathway protein D
VLGGLLEDVLRESEQRVPVLGSIPVLGALFRAQKTAMVKTNLLIFIRPKILRDAARIATETNTKYNRIKDVLDRSNEDGINLMPGQEGFALPPFEEANQPRTPLSLEEAGITEQSDEP